MGQQLPEGTRCANSEARGYWHGEQDGGIPGEWPKAQHPSDQLTEPLISQSRVIAGHPGSPQMPRPGPDPAILGVGVVSDGLE